MPSAKQTKKLKQMYRRELRDELQHVQVVRREEAQVLKDHVDLCQKRKPRFIPAFFWVWLINKIIYNK